MPLTKVKNSNLHDADLVTLADNGVGTGANQIVQRDGSGDIPGVLRSSDAGTTFVAPNGDGSNLTGVLKPGDAHDVLVSGTNIKSINGDSILGSGDLGVGDKDVFNILESIETPYNQPFNQSNWSYWTTTDLLIVRHHTTNKIYIFNKTSKSLVNTYTDTEFAGLIAFDVINDTLAIGCTDSVVFKVTISGNTFTRGPDSNTIPTTATTSTGESVEGGDINGIIGTSSTQAFVGVKFGLSSSVAGGNAFTACAVDISGGTPIIGTWHLPRFSAQQGQDTYLRSFKKISEDQCIAVFRTQGSSGTNAMWLLRGVGSTLQAHDTGADIYQPNGSQSGYGFWRDISQGGSLGEGYGSTIFSMGNGRFCFVEVSSTTFYNFVMLDIPPYDAATNPTGLTYTKVSTNLVHQSATLTASASYPYRIIQGTDADDVFVYYESAYSNHHAYWNYFHSPNKNTFTSQSSGDVYSGDFSNTLQFTSLGLPNIFLNGDGGITMLITIPIVQLADYSLQPRFDTFTTNDTTHSCATGNYYHESLPIERYNMRQHQNYGNVYDTYVSQQTNPVTVGGSQYLIGYDYTLISSDNFGSGPNLSCKRTNMVLSGLQGPKSIQAVGGPFVIISTNDRFHLAEIVGQ